MAIKGMHAMFFSSDPQATRAFIRDKLAIPGKDVGDGWWIFDIAEGDLGVHPIDHEGSPPSGAHDVSFYCDDLEATCAELRGRGVELSEVEDQGWGLVTRFEMPGGVRCQLYQPRYK